MNKTLLLAVGIAGLITSPVSAKDQPETTGTIVKQSATEVIAPTSKSEKSGMLGIRRTLPDLKKIRGNPKRLAGITEYALPFYRINFLIDSDYKNEVTGGYVNASAKVLAKLEGVSQPIFDELTELTYADFKTKMTAAGFAVRADEAQYKAAMWDALQQANSMIVDYLAKQKSRAE